MLATRILKATLLLGLSTVLAVGCGSDDDSDDGSGGSAGGGLCQVGTKGCGCNLSFGCDEAGVFCVGGTCIECTEGEEGCVCDSDGMCSSGVCNNPNPGCMVSCEPSVCEAS